MNQTQAIQSISCHFTYCCTISSRDGLTIIHYLNLWRWDGQYPDRGMQWELSSFPCSHIIFYHFLPFAHTSITSSPHSQLQLHLLCAMSINFATFIYLLDMSHHLNVSTFAINIKGPCIINCCLMNRDLACLCVADPWFLVWSPICVCPMRTQKWRSNAPFSWQSLGVNNPTHVMKLSFWQVYYVMMAVRCQGTASQPRRTTLTS
jgi:hypothetical protein